MVKREVIDIIQEYGKNLKEKGIDFQKLILFGSYASNTETPTSDIDIAVISRDFGNDRFEERAKLTEIAYYIDSRIEPHPVSLNDFTEDDLQMIVHEIKSNGVEIAA